jgi:hypothetical protein
MLASQILRLHSHDAASWIFWDYAGRLSGLAVLAAMPAARAVAFRWEGRRLPLWKIALWIAGFVLMCIALVGLGRMINAALPMTVLRGYWRLRGWLLPIDLTLGLALGRPQRGDRLSTLCQAHAPTSSG